MSQIDAAMALAKLPHMKNLAGLSWSMLAFTFLLGEAQAQSTDPCDFVSGGKSAFSYAQVMECYRRLPFAKEALDNIVRVVEQHRSFSDLGEIYEARAHWKEGLAALLRPEAVQSYTSDLAMHDALKREHKNFRNAHVAYLPPDCYWRMLNAFVPLEFGSVVTRVGHSREQIIFVEDAPILPDLYRAATGIDTKSLVGMRVVSINGVPVLDYFRRYAEQQKTHEDAGGGLNGILADFEYSFRLGGPHDFLPSQEQDTYVFESSDGKRQEVKLPWLFTLSAPILGESALPPTASSEEFAALCVQTTATDLGFAQGATQFKFDWGLDQRVDRHRHHAVRRLRQHRHVPFKTQGYFEVNPESLGRNVQEIIPTTDLARVVQYDGNVTAIQLGDTGSWTNVVRQGIEYACEHSDRLIVDVRGNNGGNDTVIRWLHHYLFPEDGSLIAAGLLPLRLRNDNPQFDEVLYDFARFTKEFVPALGLDPCMLQLTPGCALDVDRGTPFTSDRYDWFFYPTQRELRGGRLITLSRQLGLPNIANPEFDSASCAGRFADEDLIVLTNGSNASGGYFLPSAFKGDGVIVNTGGFVGEPMAMGRARGGATVPGGIWAIAAQAIETLSQGAIRFHHTLEAFQRPVDSQMEMMGAYRKDRRTLHVEAPIEADLHVPVWTNRAGSEAFVYERVLRAVDERHRPRPRR